MAAEEEDDNALAELLGPHLCMKDAHRSKR
jgi:hypothetical protein